MIKTILASSSPRRIEMMKKNGYEPVAIPADIDETLPFKMSPAASVMYLALKKASHVAYPLIEKNDKLTDFVKSQTDCTNTAIIAADTVVVFRNKIIGKPQDADEAFSILSALRNEWHHVITGVCIYNFKSDGSTAKECFSEDTAVFFSDYSDEFLRRYVSTDEPYDKAGGYAIQGTFSRFIDHIEGDLDNVIGFPWAAVETRLKAAL